MRPAHSSGADRDAPRSQAAPAVARGQTAARKLLCCMRTKPQCSLHHGPPRAVQPLRYMPARSSSPKPPKDADAKGDLAALGFRVADSGPHTSKGLMLQGLEALLAAVPAGAPAKANRKTIVAGNLLGALKTREETATQCSQTRALKGYHQAFRGER